VDTSLCSLPSTAWGHELILVKKAKKFLDFFNFQVPNDGSSLLLLPGGILLAGGILSRWTPATSPPNFPDSKRNDPEKAQKLIRGYIMPKVLGGKPIFDLILKSRDDAERNGS